MLTKFDEWTCHQAVTTFDQPSTSDRAWTEKLWCNIHDTEGKLVLATGLGVYPNRNVMDGYGCVTVNNKKQFNIRLSRELRPRIDELSLGPLTYEVIEPFKRIHIELKKNNYGISFNLEFIGRMDPGEEEPQHGRSRGRVYVNTCRYAQLGRARGTVTVDGTRYDINEENFFAQRDHSWGIRMGVGAPEQGVQAPDIEKFTGMMINWLTLQFEDWGIYCYLIEKGDGTIERLTGSLVRRLDQGSEPLPIISVDHDFKYHPGSQRMASGVMTFTFSDNSSKTISMKEITVMYLRGGAYVGYRGVRHGLWLGPYWEDGEKWNIGNSTIANEVHGLDDTVIAAKCGNETGYGIIENMIFAPFPKYNFTEWGFKPADMTLEEG